MHKPGESISQPSKLDFLIWPRKGLTREKQEELEMKSQAVVEEENKLHQVTVLKSEGIRFWVAFGPTSEEIEKIKGFPRVRHHLISLGDL